ncbi:MAG: GTPase ObgE [Candidatus Margulisiibacteriota bacterium]
MSIKFVDQVEIEVQGGHGGAGAISFRREKFIPFGGPDGGDGGEGGSIILRASSRLQTLMDLKVKRIYKAGSGLQGKGRNSHGQDGKSIVIDVPLGTMVFEDNELVADLTTADETLVIAKGGKGGKGNTYFATPTNRTPRRAQPGLPGENRILVLELRLIAGVGLVGLPNAGKSTLLKALTNANPKIAAYPFTTLTPNLGVLKFADQEIVIADIPGLIEGASEGAGLGAAFLRHIDRTKVLVHVVEMVPDAPEQTWIHFQTVQTELETTDYEITAKPMIVVLNKADQLSEAEQVEQTSAFSAQGIKPIVLSAAAQTGIDVLRYKILELAS